MANVVPRYPAALIANKTTAHALHDTNEIAAPVVGFVPDADGSFLGRARGDTADTTFYVLGGAFYPCDLKLAKSTSKTGSVANLQIWRWLPSA